MKVYNVPENSPVGQLINKIEEVARANGLTLSRWQTNGAGRKVTVRYAVHAGERAPQLRSQEGIVAQVVLEQAEGHTEKCRAYKKLTNFLAELA